MARFARPATLHEAVSLLPEAPWQVLAGGTDFYPARVDRPITEPVLDITGMTELSGITAVDGSWRIGALTTWTDIIQADLPPAFDALKLAAREVGSVQIQNAGTVAGNLCNASPAADGVPPLMILDAAVELTGAAGVRQVELSDFITGNRQTTRQADELVTAILIPDASTVGVSRFRKLGARRYLVISIAMVAVRLVRDQQGAVGHAAISVGSCSEVALRLRSLENDLIGHPADNDLVDCVKPHHFDALSPIDDIRATADYRRHAAGDLVRQTLLDCIADFDGRERRK